MAFDWTCPFCQKPCTIQESDYSTNQAWFRISNKHGPRLITLQFIVCPNPTCKEFALYAGMSEFKVARAPEGHHELGKQLEHWALVPPSSAKAFPDYVPAPVLQDYREACAIRDLSPKASATMSRRCLQGMIRDFWHIQKGRLLDEINALEKQVDPLTWRAIDAVRKVGNIGAHMEKDINVIVDVDPAEAEKLIGLIEFLIHDWYVIRHEREKQLKEIAEIGDSKTKTQDSGQSKL